MNDWPRPGGPLRAAILMTRNECAHYSNCRALIAHSAHFTSQDHPRRVVDDNTAPAFPSKPVVGTSASAPQAPPYAYLEIRWRGFVHVSSRRRRSVMPVPA
ncbi:hypothetical protein C8R44DRAFT_877228 [Mycena epipterygia]|nr:hypothetical protein C8R44DRAFT_877228 [Mycena epipterygia]